MEEINISYQITRKELECCICMNDIVTPLNQCSSGNHFVCSDCKKRLKNNKCPICRTSVLFHTLY
jgi:hypothetical protein